MAREVYLVEIHRPRSVSIKEMNDYLRESISNWNMEFAPEDERIGIKCMGVKKMGKYVSGDKLANIGNEAQEK